LLSEQLRRVSKHVYAGVLWMGKILFVSNTANFSKFNLPYMQWFREKGWTVDYASQGEEEVPGCDHHFLIPMARSPYSLKNIKAYFVLRKVIEGNNYSIIHCHTPMGAFLSRLAAKKPRSKGTKVIYTAHGFHFYRGAPLLNWLVYYPVEKLLARHTDCLITINEEDYQRALRKFKGPNICRINGVGINLDRFKPISEGAKSELRREFGYEDRDFVVVSVAELNKNKNHQMLVKILPSLLKEIPNLKVIFAGKASSEGARIGALIKELDLADVVSIVGYHKEVQRLYHVSDVLVSASQREGLPINVVEAIACGLPIVCSKIRGHTDVVTDGENGFLFGLHSPMEMYEGLLRLYKDAELRRAMKRANIVAANKYRIKEALAVVTEIYKSYM
jgi:glycosyltransferase EpsD